MSRPGEFTGRNRGGSPRTRKGPMSQRDLVRTIGALVDASRSRSASRTRDEARAALRLLLDSANWRTPHVLRNIGYRRCVFIARMGYPVPYACLAREGLDRLEALYERQRNGE